MSSSELKPDIQKTIKRLATQKNHDVLKNKLRSWLSSREMNAQDFLRACRERTVSVPSIVLNKLGMLYSSGREGLTEDSDMAFAFYLTASELGHATANGNVAQYYFDGRASGGRNLDLALHYCRRATELGADKFMLMSEILHEKRNFPETVGYLRKIIEGKPLSGNSSVFEYKKRMEARKLEIECLYQILQMQFAHVSGSPSANSNTLLSANGNNATHSSTAMPSPQLSSSLGNNGAISPLRSLLLSTGRGEGMSLSSPLRLSAAAVTASPPHLRASVQTHSTAVDTSVFQHSLPGWFFVSNELEGFDSNACAELTARAEVLALEADALKSAFETAETHVHYARKHKFSQQIISVLMNDKVSEFQKLFQSIEGNRALLLQSWEEYTDIPNLLLHRQIFVEKRFFNPIRCKSHRCYRLARELIHRRVYDYLDDYLDAEWTMNFRPNEWLNEPLLLSTPSLSRVSYRIPSARSIVIAERALFETSIFAFGRASERRVQVTGWTGDCNNLVQFYAKDLSNKNSTADANGKDGIKEATEETLEEGVDSSLKATINITDSVQKHKRELKDKEREREKHLLLSKERSYCESVVVGTAVLKYRHLTHPVLREKDSDKRSSSVPHHQTHHHQQQQQQTKRTDSHGHNSLRGDSYYAMEELGDSDDIWHFLNRLTLVDQDELHFVDNEKRLAEIILKFTREGKPIALADVQLLNEDATEADANHLMRIAYHYFYKRIVPYVLSFEMHSDKQSHHPPQQQQHHNHNHNRKGIQDEWSAASESSTSSSSPRLDHEVPLASGQARAWLLLLHGHLTIRELFAEDSPYGLFFFRSLESEQNVPVLSTNPINNSNGVQSLASTPESEILNMPLAERVRTQLSNINALYQKAILELRPQNFSSSIRFWKAHRHGVTVPTYATLRRELGEVYGGDSDSEDEADGLENDISNSGRREGNRFDRDVYGADDKELETLLSRLKI